MLMAYLDDHDLPAPVELVLYVVGRSESCEKARRNLAHAVRQYAAGQVKVVVRDLSAGPQVAEDHKIVIVPTVMMRRPRLVFLPGDLHHDAGMLHDLLRSCGLKRSSSSRR